MRIHVRVAAPVESLRYARQASRFFIRTGAEPKIGVSDQVEKRTHRGGVIHRLSGGACPRAPSQPVNNAGKAIQIFNLPYRRFGIGRPFELAAGSYFSVRASRDGGPIAECNSAIRRDPAD
jgi:hypothetical protein